MLTYNNAGQLIQTSHRIGTGATVTLASLQYNDLGQVTTKTFPGASNAEINFTYNIRGWLRKINDPALSNSATKLFAQELLYETGATTNNWNGNISGVNWLGRDDTLRQYRYAYDPANRITAATYTVPTVTAENTRYNVSGITYDLNGNITAMQRRNQMTATTYGLVDNLTYTYDTHGNRLLQVADAVAGATHTSKDFKERSATNYGYDVNGNLTANADKEITAISYFHHNLPREITLSGTNRRVVYQYDAEGNKVRETQHNGGTSTIRDYVGEFVLVGGTGTIDHLVHEEGRVTQESGTFKYEFFVKDHLGNVRQVLKGPETTSGGVFRLATMEPENAEEEKKYFTNLDESRQGAGEHNLTPGGYATVWLNADRGRILGPATTQDVTAGDSVEIEVFGKYVDPKKFRILPASFLRPENVNAVTQQLAELGQQAAAAGPNQVLIANAIAIILTDLRQKKAPEAYMGYALYDADSNMYESGKILLSKKARNKHEELNRKLYISKDGYMEAFLVNETSENVWFDQFRIETTTPIILQETHYDPWGVELQGLGYQEPGSKVNKYLYNGKEFNDHQGLNLFDYGARLYDAAVGRWFTVDPLAELPSQIAHSPFVYAWNNPVGMIDPTGMAAEECKGCPEPKDGDPGAGTGYGGITVTASRILDLPDFSSVQKSNQNAQAGWGGGGNSGGSGDYKSPNIEAADRYFNPNRPPSSGAISPDYTIEGITLPVFGFLKALKIPGIQSWLKGIAGKRIGQGFDSFYAFKKAMGPAGPGQAWHHIVEQTPGNLVRFGNQAVHNTSNLMRLPHGAGSIHAKISGHYSSKQFFTNGQTVREWLSTQSYQEQYNYGIKMLKQFGWTP